ncbi:MAG TPA: TIGR03435 family protein [Bryobacteraceae bacterium]|nr:TIGR03435 family protein [Bryobacteraceae bacterium]
MIGEVTNHVWQSTILRFELTLVKKIALAISAVAAITAPIAMGVSGATRTQAQSQPAPKFETAAVKRCSAFRGGVTAWAPATQFHSECTTIERLIQQAYGLFANGHWNPGSFLTVIGGPDWTTSALYQIAAKAEHPQTRATMNGPMLQALLEDKFKLSVHRETREMPAYVLMVAEGGPKFQPFQGTCTPRDFDKPPSPTDCAVLRGYGSGFDVKAGTMADLCTGLSVLLERHVTDETGIAGRFNIHLDLSGNGPRSLPALSDPTVPPPAPVSYAAAKSALKKAGLNLSEANRPGEFLVIDHIERPSGT